MTSPYPASLKGVLEGPSEHESLTPNQNHTRPTENDLPTIYITSYGHRIGPLLPAPDLAFDLRAMPGPPKNVRTGNTGLSQALRDALFADARVQQRFHDTCAVIRSGAVEACTSGAGELKVGVCCEFGKHRSVAFVEELARVRFEGWNVVVGHRDVHRKKTSKKSGRSSSRRDHTDGNY